jgi:hypothetical protein
MDKGVKYVVVSFNPPEDDFDASFDCVVGIYDDKEEAEKVAKSCGMGEVHTVRYYG